MLEVDPFKVEERDEGILTADFHSSAARVAREAHAMVVEAGAEGRTVSVEEAQAAAAALRNLERELSPLAAAMETERARLMAAGASCTREWLRDIVLDWVADPVSRVFWLKGGPGVGKSVVAAFVADELQERHLLGASFFCKHDDENRKSAHVSIGLAAGLSDFLTFAEG